MKAVLCNDLALGIDGLKVDEVPNPSAKDLKPSQVLLKVHAAGLNFADTLMVKGLYQVRPPLPFIPAGELCGTVEAMGPDVQDLAVGDRVAAVSRTGALAEYCVVDQAVCVPVPVGVSNEVAAGFAVTYGTAHLCLHHRTGLKAGETLLVHGAAGGVGSAAVQIGKLAGARVIATASTGEKLDIAKAAGADEAILSSDPELVEKLKALGGCDVALDPVGGDMFKASLRALKWQGRLLVVGFASGSIENAPSNIALVKNLSIVGCFWGSYLQHAPHIMMDGLKALLQLIDKAELRPLISHKLPLAEAAKGLSILANRQAEGKVVILP